MHRMIWLAACAALMMFTVGESLGAARSFFKPKATDGARLSFCQAGAATCGKRVADTWCQDHQYERALMFQRETLKESCDGNACVLFRQIKCWAPSDRN